MVGIQGSGKSHFAANELETKDYVIASNDITGSRDKTIRVVDKALINGDSVVVDNTHAEKEARKKFVDIAKKHNVQCRYILFRKIKYY